MQLANHLHHYLALMRFDKPIGWLLLLWPTLWALWIAGEGRPLPGMVWIFVLGVIVMRSAGCVINDYADRDIDHRVERTRGRPLTAGLISPTQALVLFLILAAVALLLLLMLPMRVWPWSVPAALITIVYPFMKRFIQTPQLVLGLAFSFGIPMAFAAFNQPFDFSFWLLVAINMIWVLVYDSQYAMSDREDDLKIGIKSTAILFAHNDKRIIAVLQVLVVVMLVCLGFLLGLTVTYYFGLLLVVGLFTYQQYLIRHRDQQACFQAFLNNGWVGGVVWFALLLAYPAG